MILLLSACSKESKGVPDSVIRRNTSYTIDKANKYGIIHDVDTDSHIDDLQMKLYFKGTYGTKTVQVPCSYQYNKADDSWTLLDEGPATSKQLLDEDSYIKSSPWKGAAEGYHDYSYSITFLNINMDRMEAVIHCDIDFKRDDIPDLNKTITVDFIEIGGSYNLHFEIDYIYPGMFSDKTESLWFWLDIDDGLRPF